MKTSQEYETALRNCSLCAPMLGIKPVDPTESSELVFPRPIVRPLARRPVMLVGQAPGLTEYRSGKPFSGPAGQDVRELFADCGCGPQAFNESVHPSAVVKCFPGSKLSCKDGRLRRQDVKPCARMRNNCRPYLKAQLDIVDPKLLVLLGSVALQAYIELRTGRKGGARLSDYVGRVEEWNERRVVALAHSSGGSFWLNQAENRLKQAEAKLCLSEELRRLLA